MNYQILIVDDDPDARYAYEIVAKQVDAEALVAENGEVALAIMQSEVPDLVLLDLMMPGMTGFELLRYMQADEALRGVPVMVTSALISADPDQFKLPGVVDVIPKSGLPLSKVVERVQRVLTRSPKRKGRQLPALEPRSYLYE